MAGGREERGEKIGRRGEGGEKEPKKGKERRKRRRSEHTSTQRHVYPCSRCAVDNRQNVEAAVCPPMSDWTSCTGHVHAAESHAMEYCSALKSTGTHDTVAVPQRHDTQRSQTSAKPVFHAAKCAEQANP